MTDPDLPGPPPPAPITSSGSFLLEIFRSIGAYGVLFVCIILLLRRPAWDLSMIDAVFWGVLILLLIVHGRAAKVAGTTRAWGRARLQHVAVALLLWVGAQSVHLIR
ncbi:MAG: hypothetical protein Q7V88_00180 [Actinomycetota bacterium]|nr:hypothetical protein [Actinomycetota bacterium]